MIQLNKVKLFLFFILAGTIYGFSSLEYIENTSKDDESLEAFQTILEVLRSPRCMNCHPSNDVPKVGDDRHPHLFGVVRGEDDHGGPAQMCSTCHQDENNEYSMVPGAPHWGLAPISMGWEGLNDAELGAVLLDTSKNGNRTPEDLVKHMSEDALVLWAWEPGGERTPPPVPLNEFKAALQTWLDNGAKTP